MPEFALDASSSRRQPARAVRTRMQDDRQRVLDLQRKLKAAGHDPGPLDGIRGPRTRRAEEAFRRAAATASSRPAADRLSLTHLAHAATQAETPSAGGPIRNEGRVQDGLVLPRTEGKATTFWNGNYPYKGKRDAINMMGGAWGDRLHPTEYFIAIPVGLEGGGKAWHNRRLLVTNPENGKQVVLAIQDKGPHPRTGADFDLSPVAKEALGVGFMTNMRVEVGFAPRHAPLGPVNQSER